VIAAEAAAGTAQIAGGLIVKFRILFERTHDQVIEFRAGRGPQRGW
jgi:hypothetical protein